MNPRLLQYGSLPKLAEIKAKNLEVEPIFSYIEQTKQDLDEHRKRPFSLKDYFESGVASVCSFFCFPYKTTRQNENEYINSLKKRLERCAKAQENEKQAQLLQRKLDQGMGFAALKPLLSKIKGALNFKPFLPEDPLIHVIQHLSEKEASTIIPRFSWGYRGFFQESALQGRLKKKAQKTDELFQLLINGEQEKLRASLERIKTEDPALLVDLLMTKETVTDFAGRQFDRVTLFQLALWMRDRHMWRMLLHYLPEKEAMKQFIENDSGQTDYAAKQGKHYDPTDLQGIVRALDTYDQYCQQQNFNLQEANRLWIIVGEAQKKAPRHVIQEYCRVDATFDPLNDARFKEEILPRMTRVRFLNWHMGTRFTTFGSTPIYRGRFQESSQVAGGLEATQTRHADLEAIRRLFQVREEEYEQLKKQFASLKLSTPGFRSI